MINPNVLVGRALPVQASQELEQTPFGRWGCCACNPGNGVNWLCDGCCRTERVSRMALLILPLLTEL